MVVLFEYCVIFIMVVNTPSLILTEFVKLTAPSMMTSLRILWAISGLQHPRKHLFRSHSNLRRRVIFLVVTCPQPPPEFIHEDDQFLSNIYI